jgi:hypothetical protein
LSKDKEALEDFEHAIDQNDKYVKPRFQRMLLLKKKEEYE